MPTLEFIAEIKRLKAEIDEALDRIGDMLKQDDGQAYKEAQRFYDKHRGSDDNT